MSIRFCLSTLAGTLVFLGQVALTPGRSQTPVLPNVGQSREVLSDPEEAVVSGCVRFDGGCLFRMAAPRSELDTRIEIVEQRLFRVNRVYQNSEDARLIVYAQPAGENLWDIYASIDSEEPLRLFSVTPLDAEITGVSVEERADRLSRLVERGFERAKQELSGDYFWEQGRNAAIVLGVMVVASVALHRLQARLRRTKRQLQQTDSSGEPISARLVSRQRFDVNEVQQRLFQILQFGIWVGGSLYILGLFPQTRLLQYWAIRILRIPFRLGVTAWLTYFVTRISYTAIDRLVLVLVENRLLTPEANQRLQLRVATISGVAKSIATVTWTVIGILVGLAAVGVNIAPILAGAGIIGVAISLASQNLIRDAINGFFIILEDQYAIGDVINVGEVGGWVENINLRITQLRDEEGRLITVPNSEIRIVANLSSSWSRADLKVPIAYPADIDRALDVVKEVTAHMSRDGEWKTAILEPPKVLGVDDFGDRGLVIRIWIVTLPLKQWDVSRECRRRLKVALDREGIPLSRSQWEIWYHPIPQANGRQRDEFSVRSSEFGVGNRE